MSDFEDMEKSRARLRVAIDEMTAFLSAGCWDGCEDMHACVDPPCQCRSAARRLMEIIAAHTLVHGPLYFAIGGHAFQIAEIPPLVPEGMP